MKNRLNKILRNKERILEKERKKERKVKRKKER